MKSKVFGLIFTIFFVIVVLFNESIGNFFYDFSGFLNQTLGLKFDLMAIVFICLAVAIFVWAIVYVVMHRQKDDLIEVVELKSPDDMTPVEVGFLVDGTVDGSDMSSLIIYWASKKIIEISGDKKNQTLKKLTELPEDSRDYEKRLFNAIFKGSDTVPLSDVQVKAVDAAKYTIDTVEKTSGKKYFDQKVLNFRQIFASLFLLLIYVSFMYCWLELYSPDYDQYWTNTICLIMIVVILMFVCSFHFSSQDYKYKKTERKTKIKAAILTPVAFAGAIAAAVLFFVLQPDFQTSDIFQISVLVIELVLLFVYVLFARKLQIYSEEGWKKLGQAIGFKQYLTVVEEDRIKMLVDENPEVFYEILPYAYALGVSDKWIKQFNVITAELPDEKKRQIAFSTAVGAGVIISFRGFHVSRYGGNGGMHGGPRGGGTHGGGGFLGGGGHHGGGGFGGSRR